MDTIKILYIHSMMFHGKAWKLAADRLSQHGIDLRFTNQRQALEILKKESPDILIAELSVGEPQYNELLGKSEKIVHRLGLSAETPATFTTFTPQTNTDFSDYTCKISVDNYIGSILILAAAAGYNITLQAKKEVLSCGLYHPDSSAHFCTIDEYLQWRQGRNRPTLRSVGIIFYYGQLVGGHLGEIDSLIWNLEKHGLCPLPVFSAGIEQDQTTPDWYQILNTDMQPGAIISCLAGRLLKHQVDISLFEQLDVPIIQSLRSHSQTPEQWFEDPQGLPAMSAVFSLTYPEMFGAIRPTMIGGLQQSSHEHQSSWLRSYVPIPERIEQLCRRLIRHFTLKETPNSDKRVTIILHNNPCKGVEATVGMAVGLDTFTSLGLFIQALGRAGYKIGDCPKDGGDILQEILTKKAIAEFRWTTIDEIIAKGGALHLMDQVEYSEWFDKQSESVRQKIITDWGEFPGQSMAWQHKSKNVLVITGLKYGNIQIINQPKRGCYGAKCNGEVCRILHDPNLSPPHHWFATYAYINKTSDAVIHFGTEGALEYLPGKQNGLSGSCFPEVTLDDLPNFYLYVMDAIGEGMVAKRRGQATLVDHLGPVLSPAQPGDELSEMENLLDQYSQAKQADDKERSLDLENELQVGLIQLHIAEDNNEMTFAEQCTLARGRINAVKKSLAPEGLHILGQAPSRPSRGRLLATMLRRPAAGIPSTEELGSLLTQSTDGYDATAQMLAGIHGTSKCSDILPPALKTFCLELEEKLQACQQEIDNLLHCLDGGYIPPGPAGSLAGGRIELLPTGKNFYAKDVSLLPTRAAHRIGTSMANRLLRRYLDDEDCFPEGIGISIWSSDAFKSDGELFCQILSLMGVNPVWDKQGKVEELEVIPLPQLTLTHKDQKTQRPRVDVTIETSGIMRDMVPHFCELLDRAVLAVCDLDEPLEYNFIKKHTEQQLDELRLNTRSRLNEKEMHRMATFRVFSSAPGSYGLGVGLALDASAWTTDTELAEIYINWGGHGYGAGGETTVARDILARQLAQLDIAYMKQASEEYDILDCGCYSVSQGGMATATRALAGKQAKLYWAEADSTGDLCDVREQLQRSAASRLLNSGWIEEMKQHGYQGAMAVSSRVNNLYKWSATSHQVSKDLFDKVVATYILNTDNRQWLLEENPYAMEEITRRLLEAASRDLWQADADMLKAVQHTALEVEGDMEEMMGDVSEEFQGNTVEVLGRDKVKTWQHEWRLEK